MAMYWPRRVPKQKQKQPKQLPPALPQGLLDEFHQRPWLGTSFGEMLPLPAPVPTPQPAPVWRPPPPDWAAEENERRERDNGQPEPATAPAITAIESLMATAAERGELEEPPPLGPPDRSFVPLIPIAFPEPDWRNELAQAESRQERERLEHARQLLDEAEPSRPDYPAKRKASPAAERDASLRITFPPPPWKGKGAA